MKKMKLALIAAVVGAISMAPTQLLPATAAILGSSTSASKSISSGTFGAVAAGSSGITTASPYAVTGMGSVCSVNQTTVNAFTLINSSTIRLLSVGSLTVGMVIAAGSAGIAAGTKVTAISTGSVAINITPNTTVQLGKSATITFSGCYQKFFSVNNIGSIALASFQIRQTVTTTGTSGTITLQSCSGTWTEASGACTGGTISDIGTTNSGGTGGPFTVSKALSVGSLGTVRLRTFSHTIGLTSTVSIDIAQANLRAAITTNS